MPPEIGKTCGLRLLYGDKPSILILGSYPSIISLEKGEYYANKRNNFWRIMESLFGIEMSLPYHQRVEKLFEKGIALWDVVSECSREGSSDSKIKDVIPNDILGFLNQNPSVKCITLNGSTGAGRLFKKIYGELPQYPGVKILVLKSTSPANAGYTYNEKLSEWENIVEFTR